MIIHPLKKEDPRLIEAAAQVHSRKGNPIFSSLQKFNPYHDERGRFASRNNSFLGGSALKDGKFLSKEEYVSSLVGIPRPSDSVTTDTPEGLKAWVTYLEKERILREEWDRQIHHALAMGELSGTEAQKLGWYGDASDKVELLPPELYHVTTNRRAVLEEGLKTRVELGQRSGHGLGGGTSNTVSFTTDAKVAEGIHDAILLASKVARNEVTPQQLLDMAGSGVGAAKPWLEGVLYYFDTKWKAGQPYPPNLTSILEGTYHTTTIRRDSSGNPLDPDHARPTGNPKSGHKWELVEDKHGVAHWKRPYTEEESLDRRMTLFKAWAAFRELAGGPLDPVFFDSDYKALAKLKESDVATIKFRPKPKAQGYKVSALGEWRTWTGKAVELDKVLKEDSSSFCSTEEISPFSPSELFEESLRYLHSKLIQKFNPYHDERGRFTSKDRAFSNSSTGEERFAASGLKGFISQEDWESFVYKWEIEDWADFQHAARAVISGLPKEEYVCEDCKGDDAKNYEIAQKIITAIEAMPTVGRPLYRGIVVSADLKVGDRFSESLSSWTEQEDLALRFVRGEFGGGGLAFQINPDSHGVVIKLDRLSVGNAKGISISNNLPKRLRNDAMLPFCDEWLTSGEYEVTQIVEHWDDDREESWKEIVVRRVGPAAKINLKKSDALAQKANPYHDERGRFTTRDNAARGVAYSGFGRDTLRDLKAQQRKAQKEGKVPKGVRVDAEMDGDRLPAESLIHNLTVFSKFQQQNVSGTKLKYGGIEAFVLGEGKEFDVPDAPPPIELGEPKRCFSNSVDFLMNHSPLSASEESDYTYVEGFVQSPKLPIPIHHAWLVDNKTGTVVDPTLGWCPKARYYGVPFSRKFLYRKLCENKVYGLFIGKGDMTTKLVRGQDKDFTYRG